MTIIYSNTKVGDLEGRYIAPKFFTGGVIGAALVYTDDDKIKEAYKEVDVEVRGLGKNDKNNDNDAIQVALEDYFKKLDGVELNDESLQKIEDAGVDVKVTKQGELYASIKKALDGIFMGDDA